MRWIMMNLLKSLKKIKVHNNWIKIASSKQAYQIELLKGMLEENNIIAVSVNKNDSSYLAFGEIELFVKSKDVIQAKNLIKIQNERKA
ncbi:MAG: hypothetical protein CBC83_03900 [Flavobacteriales bacterium TMED123]|nr:MAG: hypothetical protein CBC83_03900 [Flavobacteriales bacterium TMED123]